MNNLSQYIQEKLHLNRNINTNEYSCHPKNKYDLMAKIIERFLENGRHKMFNGDLNDIDVSEIDDMSGLINIANRDYGIKLERKFGNVDISKWDVSNLKYAQSMFFGCHSFNCDLSNWNIENLENATAMFAGCEELDFDISKWNPEKLKETDKTWKMIVNTKLEKQNWMR